MILASAAAAAVAPANADRLGNGDGRRSEFLVGDVAACCAQAPGR